MKQQSKGIIIGGIITFLMVVAVILYSIHKEIDKQNEGDHETKPTEVSELLKDNNQKATHEGIINSPVQLDKYYRNKFYDSERKVKDGKNIDKDIKELKDNIASDSSKNRYYDNKTNIMSGYKSALITLNELNENNKKGNKKNNDVLIYNINEQLSYSQRELIKTSKKDE
ncbi:hypothetical protein [Pseudoalteromonas undina]|nr:hypothetical protein [Pseudoalteromonas undina]